MQAFLGLRQWLSAALLVGVGAASIAQPTFPQNGIADNREGYFALTGATVYTQYNTKIANATLVVRKGAVESVTANGAVPKGAVAINCQGKTIYPSFIDPLTAYGQPELKAEGGGQQAYPQMITNKKGAFAWNEALKSEFRANEAFVANEAAAKELREIGYGAVLSHRADGISRGAAAVVTLGNDREHLEVVREQAAHVLSFGKGSSTQAYPNSLMGAIALLRQTYLDGAWYKNGGKRTEYNASLEAWNNLQALPQVFVAGTWQDELRAAKIAAEFGAKYVLKGINNTEYQRVDALKATGCSFILPLNFPLPYDVEDPYDALQASLTDLKHWEMAPANAARLAKAAIPFAFTTTDLKDKKEFLKNLRRAIKMGLAKADALKALTATPAEMLQVSDKLGSLEKGKLANFIITNGDIFEEKTIILQNWTHGKGFILTKALENDLRGSYTLTVGAQKYALAVGGTAEKPELKIDLDDTTQLNVTYKVNEKAITLGFVPNAKENKTITLSGLLEKPENWAGNGTLADGTWTAWQAVRIKAFVETPKEKTEKSEKTEKNNEQPEKIEKNNEKIEKPEKNKEQPQKLEKNNEQQPEKTQKSNEKNQKPEKSEKNNEPQPEKANQPDKKNTQKIDTTIGNVIYPFVAFGNETLPTAQTFLIKNATVWTNEQDGIVENTDVLIENGKIANIGKNLTLPQGATAIDGTGKHLTAGIIDEHSHIAISRGVNEGSQESTAEVRIGDVINSEDINIYRQLAGGVTCSQLLHGSANPIGGQSAIIKLRWGYTPESMKVENADGFIKFALGENVKQSNAGDNATVRYPQTRMGVEQVYRDYFARAKEYDLNKDNNKRRDLDLEALAEVLNKKRFVTCHSYVQSEILMLMKVAEDCNFRVNTFTHILEGYKVAKQLKEHGASASTFSDWWAYKMEVQEAIPYNGALLNTAGVNVGFNSDNAEMGRRLNQEAAKAVQYGGVTPEDALKFVTLNPAKMLHLDGRMGSIKKGKDADVVLWSAHPLSVYAHADYTFIDGIKFFDRAADTRAQAALPQVRAQLIQKMLKEKQDGKPTQGVTAKKQKLYECDTIETEY